MLKVIEVMFLNLASNHEQAIAKMLDSTWKPTGPALASLALDTEDLLVCALLAVMAGQWPLGASDLEISEAVEDRIPQVPGFGLPTRS